jgi:hypothetical protein
MALSDPGRPHVGLAEKEAAPALGASARDRIRNAVCSAATDNIRLS